MIPVSPDVTNMFSEILADSFRFRDVVPLLNDYLMRTRGVWIVEGGDYQVLDRGATVQHRSYSYQSCLEFALAAIPAPAESEGSADDR